MTQYQNQNGPPPNGYRQPPQQQYPQQGQYDNGGYQQPQQGQYDNNGQQQRIFVGSGKLIDTRFGKMMKVSFNANDLETMRQWLNERGWVTLAIQERRQPSPHGSTHYLEVDTWRPEYSNNDGGYQQQPPPPQQYPPQYAQPSRGQYPQQGQYDNGGYQQQAPPPQQQYPPRDGYYQNPQRQPPPRQQQPLPPQQQQPADTGHRYSESDIPQQEPDNGGYAEGGQPSPRGREPPQPPPLPGDGEPQEDDIPF